MNKEFNKKLSEAEIFEDELEKQFQNWLRREVGMLTDFKNAAIKELEAATRMMETDEKTVEEYKKLYGDDANMDVPRATNDVSLTSNLVEGIQLYKNIINTRNIEITIYEYRIRRINMIIDALQPIETKITQEA